MFSMCSELTLRARIPDTRIPQLMQPWLPIYLKGSLSRHKDPHHLYIFLLSPFTPLNLLFLSAKMNRSTNKAIEKNNAYKHHRYYRHICYICYKYPECHVFAQVILAFSVFMLAIAERMPETSESIPLIGDFNLNAGVW